MRKCLIETGTEITPIEINIPMNVNSPFSAKTIKIDHEQQFNVSETSGDGETDGTNFYLYIKRVGNSNF